MGFPIDAPLEPSPYLQAFSRYLAQKCLSNANRHCACAISRDLYPLCKIWVHILISHPHIAYSLWHFYWAPMKNKGCLLMRPPMLLQNRAKNFWVQNFAKFWPFRGAGGQGFLNFSIFTAKGTSLRESTPFEPFCVKISWGVWPPGVFLKKSKKVSDSHRKDMWPLTQGLNYRSACDATKIAKYSLVMTPTPCRVARCIISVRCT